MTWSLSEWLRGKRAAERDAELRELRGKMAQAVVTNDRKAHELRQTMAGALRLRKEYDK